MRDGSLVQRNFYEILLSILDALGDSGGNFIGLSETIAYHTLLVAHYYDSGEAEVTSALGYLGNPLNCYQSVLEFQIGGLYFLY